MMTKVYIFLIFMVLILPSLGLTRYSHVAPSCSEFTVKVTSGERCPGENGSAFGVAAAL